MTFPVVAARTTTADASATLSHAINLGSPNAGDLLIVVSGSQGAGGAYQIDENVSGQRWTEIASAVGSNLRMAAFAKVAVGGGGDALTLRTVTATRIPSICYRITGHGSYIGGGSTATATSTNGDPPNAAITGAAQDVLFLAAMVTTTSVASVAPSSYSSLTTASVNNSFMSAAERTLNGTADNPGTFTNTSQEWIATSFAVPELSISTNARQTQEVVEVLSAVSTNAARATQVVAEVASQVSSTARVTQVVVEMVSQNVPNNSGGPSMLIIAT